MEVLHNYSVSNFSVISVFVLFVLFSSLPQEKLLYHLIRCLKQRNGLDRHHGNSLPAQPHPHEPVQSNYGKALLGYFFLFFFCHHGTVMHLWHRHFCMQCHEQVSHTHRTCDTSWFPLAPTHTHMRAYSHSCISWGMFIFIFITTGAFIDGEKIEEFWREYELLLVFNERTFCAKSFLDAPGLIL